MSSSDAVTIRTTTNPLIRWAGRQLKRLNDRHPWSHNHHFHGWILRHLPLGAGRVLDVGCGRGDLVAALRTRVPQVEGIDPDPAMAYLAASRFRDSSGVRISRRRFEDLAEQEARHGAYDAITMVASLHHMDLEHALAGARALLRPGGRLLVVTLVRPVTPLDHAWDLSNALTNPVIGVIKHPRPALEPPDDAQLPVQDPAWSLDELKQRAQPLIPGARIRRREGFRVTLWWEKPPGSTDA